MDNSVYGVGLWDSSVMDNQAHNCENLRGPATVIVSSGHVKSGTKQKTNLTMRWSTDAYPTV